MDVSKFVTDQIYNTPNSAAWLIKAAAMIGQHEIKGAQHNPEILRMWKDSYLSGVKDDETAWCAAFACASLERVGEKSPRNWAALSFKDWGCNAAPGPGETPWLGTVAVYSRGSGQGHVGFVVGVDARGRYLVLGGNQGDQVSVAALPALGKTGRGLTCVALRLPWWCGRIGNGTGVRCAVMPEAAAAVELGAEAVA